MLESTRDGRITTEFFPNRAGDYTIEFYELGSETPYDTKVYTVTE